MPHPTATPLPPFTSRELRNVLGSFATGVTIVTTADAQGHPVGLTVSSFNAVSLEPALVLWSLGRQAASLPTFLESDHYAIHVLSAEQGPLALRFAARDVDRWAGIAPKRNAEGVPLLPQAAAVFECRNRNHHVEGDHVIFIAEVLRCHHDALARPLVYHAGGFHALQDDGSRPADA